MQDNPVSGFFFNLKSRPLCNLSCALQDQDTKIDNRDHGDAGDQDDDHERSHFFGKSAICLFAICYCLTAAFDNGDDDDTKMKMRMILK